MKHAYLITIHRNFKVLRHLLEVLDGLENDFYVLIDKKVRGDFNTLIGYEPVYSHLYEVPRVKISWASYSSILAEIQLLSFASAQGSYGYYHFMQGADFLIKSREEIYYFFEKNKGYEFIHYDPKWYREGEYKVNYHHFFVNNSFYRKWKHLRLLSHGIARFERIGGLKRSNRTFYSGSAVWSISEELCQYILQRQSELLLQARHTLAADEVLIQTLVMESPFRNNLYLFEIEGANLYCIDWKRRNGSSPHTFTENDFDYLTKLPENYLFARKFDEDESLQLIHLLIGLFDGSNADS